MSNLHEPHEHDHATLEHHHTVWEELLCHFPYAIFSVAISMIVLSLISSVFTEQQQAVTSYRLFHNFHFLHLLFAATGTVLTFRRFSKSIVGGIIVGLIVPAVFCTISDAFLPYLGGTIINLHMHFHWCFITHLDTVLPFLIVGMINGWAMSLHDNNLKIIYSLGFHFFHILVSSMASILYLVSFGFSEWWAHMGFVFLFLICAVLIPCTLSDIVIPMIFARIKSMRHNG